MQLGCQLEYIRKNKEKRIIEMKKNNKNIPHPRKSLYTVIIKRIIDFFLSGLAILLLCPLFIIIILGELIFHGRPVFYIQKRPGLHEKVFCIYKFRSMTEEKGANGDLLPGSQRITKFGRFLRRFSLDELPELFCILTGKMSIIGPRPLLPEYLPYYTERHRMRHSVRPGLACFPLKPMKSWTWNDQFENDIWYIQHVSFIVDVKMVLVTIREALRGSEYRVDDKRDELKPGYWKA